MHDPLTVLGSGRLGRVSWVLFHRDRKGVDGACNKRNGPYNCCPDRPAGQECDLPPVPMPDGWEYCAEQKRFLRDLRRDRRRRWMHVHHWRLRVHLRPHRTVFEGVGA